MKVFVANFLLVFTLMTTCCGTNSGYRGESRIRKVTVGYSLVGEPLDIELDRRIVLLRDITFTSGRLLKFHAVFSRTDCGVYFQIWHPMGYHGGREVFVLRYQHYAEATVESGLNITVDVSGERIRVSNGDRLGMYNADCRSSGVAVAMADTYIGISPPSITMYKLKSTEKTVSKGNIITFEGLAFPYKCMLSATYQPDSERDRLMKQQPQQPYYGYSGSSLHPGQPSGLWGPRGEPGPRGPDGPPGEIGATGSTGATGNTGIPGIDGTGGLTGAVGATGITGPRGLPGDTGPKGLQGETGATGAPGADGEPGQPGQQGPPGLTGAAGPHGEPGETGGTGATGSTGATGGTGPRGDRGPVGEGCLKSAVKTSSILTEGESSLNGGDGAVNTVGVNVCALIDHGCEHDCLNLATGFVCTCEKGRKLRADNKTCEDEDECLLDNGGCEFSCSNTDGSYQCACASGLQLTANRHTCEAIPVCTENNGDCPGQCLDVWGGHLCLDTTGSDDTGANRPGQMDEDPDGNKDKDADKGFTKIFNDALVNKRVLIGIIIWLAIVTLIVLVLILIMCVQRHRNAQERKRYLNETGVLRY